MQLTVGGIAWL